MFSISFKNSVMKKRNERIWNLYQLVSIESKETGFLTNQHAYFLWAIF